MMKEGWFQGVDGTRLYYRTIGEGSPIVLNDGIGCDGYVWKYLIPYFQDRYQFVHWNYKGHGQSDAPRNWDMLSIPDLAKDLNKLFELLELPPSVLVGHSMGVQVVLEFAKLFPQKTSAVIPICGSYGNPLDTFHDNSLLKTVFPFAKKAALYNTDVSNKIWNILVHSELAYQIAVKFEVNGQFVKREDFQPYFDHIGDIDSSLFIKMLSQAQEHSAKDALPSIKAPVLIVGGEKDTFTPMWLSREMLRLLPNAELLVVPTGSHTAPIEMPELINLRVEKFLREKIELPAERAKAKETAKPKKAPAKKKSTPKKKAATKKKATPKKAASKKAKAKEDK